MAEPMDEDQHRENTDGNPYESPSTSVSSVGRATNLRSSKQKWTIGGFAFGAAFPGLVCLYDVGRILTGNFQGSSEHAKLVITSTAIGGIFGVIFLGGIGCVFGRYMHTALVKPQLKDDQ